MAEAKDGYRAVFALAELDRGFTDKKVILVDKMDGKSLPTIKVPFQVIAEGEKKTCPEYLAGDQLKSWVC